MRNSWKRRNVKMDWKMLRECVGNINKIIQTVLKILKYHKLPDYNKFNNFKSFLNILEFFKAEVL